MPDEIDRVIEDFINELKKVGIDLIKELQGSEFTEEQVRSFLRLSHDEKLFKEKYGVGFSEFYLMEDGGLSLEEAKYVIANPCLKGPEESCDYYKDGKCIGYGCTLLNGWLVFKTGPDRKPRPNYRALAEFPKETLYIDAKAAIKDGTLGEKISEFLDES